MVGLEEIGVDCVFLSVFSVRFSPTTWVLKRAVGGGGGGSGGGGGGGGGAAAVMHKDGGMADEKGCTISLTAQA